MIQKKKLIGEFPNPRTGSVGVRGAIAGGRLEFRMEDLAARGNGKNRKAGAVEEELQ